MKWSWAPLLVLTAVGHRDPRTVRIEGSSVHSACISAEISALGLQVCEGPCSHADAVVSARGAEATLSFEDGSSQTVPLSSTDDCVALSERVRAKLLPLSAAPRRTPPVPVPSARPAHSAAPTAPSVTASPQPAPPRDTPVDRGVPEKPAAEPPLSWPRSAFVIAPMLRWDGGSPALGLSLGARVLPASWLALGVRGAVSLTPAHFTGDEGRAETWIHSFGTEALGLWPVSRRFELAFGAGAFASHVTVRGYGAGPYPDGSAENWLAVPYAVSELSIVLGHGFRVPMGGLVGVALPSAKVRFAERVVGSVGAPMVHVWLGAQYSY